MDLRKFSLLFVLIISLTQNAFAMSKRSRVIHIDDGYSLKKPWYTSRDRGQDDQALMKLLRILAKSKTGQFLIDSAKNKANNYQLTLLDVLAVGEGSLTDTTLIRKFSKENLEAVSYEMRSKVYVSRHLNTRDAVLDLAHELTHFAFRSPFNPYRSDFAIEGFVESTIEGKGGEVEAYIIECKVSMEIFKKYQSNCQKIFDQNEKKFSKAKAINYFYRVGSHDHIHSHDETFKKHDVKIEKFTKVDPAKSALFISSAYGLPYPIAAMKEYLSIMNKACANDKKRIALIEQQNLRTPASVSTTQSNNIYEQLQSSYNNRCSNFSSI